MASISIFLRTAVLVGVISACGSYNNPYDSENGDEDFDGDGFKNSEDPNPKTPDNVVKSKSGNWGNTSINLTKNWVFFNGRETFADATSMAPVGYSMPSLDEIKAGVAAGEISSIRDGVWSTTKADRPASWGTRYIVITPSSQVTLESDGDQSGRYAIVYKKR